MTSHVVRGAREVVGQYQTSTTLVIFFDDLEKKISRHEESPTPPRQHENEIPIRSDIFLPIVLLWRKA